MPRLRAAMNLEPQSPCPDSEVAKLGVPLHYCYYYCALPPRSQGLTSGLCYVA